MEIGTIQIGNESLAWEYGLKVYDITVKSGMREFAPTWRMVLDVKSGELSPHGYTLQYLKMMELSQKNHPEIWNELLAQERIVLACYCPEGCFCHRNVLRDIISRRLGDEGREVIDLGFIK